MGPKNLLYFVSFSLQFAPPNKPWRRRDKLKNSFVFVSLYKCEWLLKNSLKKLVKYLWFWSHQKKKYAKNIFNFQLTTKATKDPDELPDDWPQRVQELLLQQLLLRTLLQPSSRNIVMLFRNYNHENEYQTCHFFAPWMYYCAPDDNT